MEVLVRNLHTRETDVAETGAGQFDPESYVLYQGRYGPDIGQVLGPVPETVRGSYRRTYAIEAGATGPDVEAFYGRERDGHQAARTCQKLADQHGLEMRLVSAHYLRDSSKLIFFFVSEHRIDFRSLVRDLGTTFHVRVELRQIGVRDESRMIGGLGICGRRLCCNGVSDRLAPVSIRMAKDQNYSLNSKKVSGPCGRLLCCLEYEHEFYRSERRNYPKEGATVDVDGSGYRVHEVNILSGMVRLFGPRGEHLNIPSCALAKERLEGRDTWVVRHENCHAAQTEVGID